MTIWARSRPTAREANTVPPLCSSLGPRRLVRGPVPDGVRRFLVEKTHERFLERYHMQAYPGRVTLMRAMNGARKANPTLGWEKYVAGGLDIHDVGGDHETMLHEPHVGALAETLKSILAG